MRLITNVELLDQVSGGLDNPDPVIGQGVDQWNDWADQHNFTSFSPFGDGTYGATSSTPVSSTKEAMDFIADLKKSVSADAKLECKVHYDNKDGKTNITVDCTITVGGSINGKK